MVLTAKQKRAIEEYVFGHVDPKSIRETFEDEFQAEDGMAEHEAIDNYIQELKARACPS